MSPVKPAFQKAYAPYSKSQKEAITLFGEDLAVSAGAGSGKTTVLVERFMAAVMQEGAGPETVLTLTFTEKAAHEMKSRLIRLCEARDLPELRQRIENSPISTIDSFCAKLLKENPIESGLDPFFKIMGEGESDILMNQVLDRLFEKEAENPGWLRILVDFGEEAIRKTLKNFYLTAQSSAQPEKLFEIRFLKSEERATRKAFSAEVEAALGALPGGKLGKTEESTKEAALQIQRFLKENTAKELSAETFFQINEQVGGLKALGKCKEPVFAIREAFEKWSYDALQQILAPSKEELLSVYRKFSEAYDLEKRSSAVYDFSDLLNKAYRLLSSGTRESASLREYYRNYFSHILVDEFQDTSLLQIQFIELLKKEGNLFVVGDPKQAIYGFRQADPDLFLEKGRFGKMLALDENYRSRKEILSFVNSIFGAVFPVEMHQELKAQKKYEVRETPAVEVLCAPRGTEEIAGLEDARIAEARSLAARLQGMVAGGFQVGSEKGGATRPIRYGDMAVLFRSTTASSFYEKEFRDLGIPFFALKGKGFYDRPEIGDLLHFLKILENPHLDISLAAILRSPLFSLSDDGLFWLAHHAKKTDPQAPLEKPLHRLDALKELSSEDLEKLGRCRDLLAEVRAQKNRMRIFEILERLISETDYEAKLLTQESGLQKTANIRKLTELAKSAEQVRALGIEDFIRYTESLAERETVESEAKIYSQGGDAVLFASIHGVKGLEFPCVTVADMGRSGIRSAAGRWSISPAWGLGVSITNPETDKPMSDLSYKQTALELQDRERREADRLLYVAMTRAKEHLILSGSVELDLKNGGIKKDGSWMSVICALIGAENVETGRICRPGHGIDFWAVPEIPKILKPGPADTPLDRIALSKALLDLKDFNAREAQKFGWPYNAQGAREIEEKFEIEFKPYSWTQDLSVTALLKKSASQEEPYRAALEDPDEDRLPRNEYGTLFHKLMEISIRLRSFPKTRKVPAWLADFVQGFRPEEKEEMIENFFGFWEHPVGREVREAKKLYPELPFIYKTPHGLVKGQMDLVFESQKGEWKILDYKTNQAAPSDKAGLEKEYEFQLGMYALVFGRLYGQEPSSGILYFSTLKDTSTFIYKPGDFPEIEARLYEAFQKAAGPGIEL